MPSPWRLGGLSWKTALLRLRLRLRRQQTPGRAAELAFYLLVSIFPLLLCVLAVAGSILEGRLDLRQQIFLWVAQLAPSADAVELIESTLADVMEQRGGKFSLGLLVALLVACQAVIAVGRILDSDLDLENRRSGTAQLLVSLAITVAVGVLLVVGVGLLFGGGLMAEWLAERFLLGDVFRLFWDLLRTPVALLFVLVGFDLIYNFAPSRNSSVGHRWLTPGAVLGVLLWLGASVGFRAYVSRFDLYSLTYGSLGVVIVLLLWLYWCGLALLVGGQFNAVIERAQRNAQSR